jgi:sugar O-acyltransferase (sialic acid O-acetyltransferase NeuD family)
MSQPLVILGTGGSALDVLDIVVAINNVAPTWQIAGFLDDAKPPGSRHLDFEVLGPLRSAPRDRGTWFINTIGSDRSYRRRPEILASTGLPPDRFATLVHPGAAVSAQARLGRGVCVNFGVSIGGGARISDQVTLCPGVIVGHDAVVEDFTILAPGAIVSGFVHVGRACYLGAGAVVRQNVHVGAGALVGMGAAVVRDVAPETVVVGNPARVLNPRA